MDLSIERLKSLANRQDFPHKDTFLATTESGTCNITTSAHSTSLDANHYLGIYRRLHCHQRKKSSRLSRALADVVDWLCKNLESAFNAPITVCAVSVGHPYSLDFFVNAESEIILGCLRTVSQLDVSTDEWERLWDDE
jgi:hypothetical protein